MKKFPILITAVPLSLVLSKTLYNYLHEIDTEN